MTAPTPHPAAGSGRRLTLGLLSAWLALNSPCTRAGTVEPTVAEALDSLNQMGYPSSRPNPKLVNVDALRPGDEVYLSSGALYEYKGFSSQPVRYLKMTILRMVERSRNDRRVVWKDKKMLTYLRGPDGRTFAIWTPFLASSYSVESFSDHVSFEVGEYVRVEGEQRAANRYPMFFNRNDEFTLTLGRDGTWIGQFMGVVDADHIWLQVRVGGFPSPVNLVVARNKVSGFATGSVTRFKRRINGLLALPLDLRLGELVRFRNAEGRMNVGTLAELRAHGVLIHTAGGVMVEVPRRRVFRYDRGEPNTTIFNAGWMEIQFDPPAGLVRDLLDGAAKLTSLTDYLASTDQEKVDALVRYLNLFLPWNKAGNIIDTQGYRTIEDVLRVGAAVCRHHAPLLATMLNEAGFRARVVKYLAEGGESGHAWVEVEIVRPNGNVVTMIVDANTSARVIPHYVASKTAHHYPESMAARFYTQPGCEHLLGEPQ